jgi:hypothetical protein
MALYDAYEEIFNNDSTLAAALLDRLLHHAETLVIEGTSCRMREQHDARFRTRPRPAPAPTASAHDPCGPPFALSDQSSRPQLLPSSHEIHVGLWTPV